MCGIVFAGGPLGSRDVALFEKMLYCDVFRGDHSTGVFSGFTVAGESFLKMEKAAVASDIFLRSELWDAVRTHKVESTITKGSFISHQPKFMVGHNRYATAGAINNRNAHPFQHGKITLVHNGSLVDQSLLPDSNRFQVDSENVAWSIDKIGIDETIQKLHGAFVLVWHNSEDQTLNFIRNDERPFHFVEANTGEWFGASEEDMIMWIMTRKKTQAPTIKRHFEAEVGTQYIFDVSEGKFKFKEERKHTLPTFRYQYSTGRGYRNWYDEYDSDWYSTGAGNGQRNTTGNASQSGNNSVGSGGLSSAMSDKYAQLNEMLYDHGINLVVGERIEFEAYAFDEYPKGESGKGKMTGYTGSGEYIEIQAHAVNKSMFKPDVKYKGKIQSCFELNYVMTIIVSDVCEATPPANLMTINDAMEQMAYEASRDTPADEEDLPSIMANLQQANTSVLTQEELNEEYAQQEQDEEEEEQCEITTNGEVYTKKDWESNGSLNCCASCGSPIPFDDVPDTFTRDGVAFCEHCHKSGESDGYPKDSGSDTERFACISCAQDLPVDAESVKDCMCIKCYEHLYPAVKALPKPKPVSGEILSIRKTLSNGMKVTRKQWQNMNECFWCREDIPFDDAEKTYFCCQKPVCNVCESKMDMGISPTNK